MDLSPSEFTTHNLPPASKLPENLDYFTLTAPPNTQISRPDTSNSITTAPMLLTRLRHPLVVAEVTVTADFEMEWDQAGLIVFTGNLPCQRPAQRRRRYHHLTPEDNEEGKWAKAGLEFNGGAMSVSSTVATSASGGDWSVSPLRSSDASPDIFSAPISHSIRIKLERIGDALWIWYQEVGGCSSSPAPTSSPDAAYATWKKIREVNSFFRGVEMKGDVWVGCYASRPVDFVAGDDWDDRYGMPESGEGRSLMVEFEDLEIL